MPNPEPHEMTEECAPAHCFFHEVDEDPVGAYIVCFECGHVYRTAGRLRHAYRRGYWHGTGRLSNPLGQKGWCSPLHVRLWRLLTIRTKNIYFCQECAHDF